MQAPAPIPVFRPSYLTDGVEFQGSLTESPANVFYQRVNASIASLSRMQFQWRSVSDQLLVSPVMMLRFKLEVQSSQLWDQLTAYCNIHGVQTTTQDVAANAIGSTTCAQIGVPALQFADGDALTNVCSSINLTFNGTSLSLNRTNRWWRDYMRTQVASDDAARIYKSSGGCYNKSDARGVAVPMLFKGTKGISVAAGDGTASGIIAGIVQDSGIAERTKNLYAMGVVASSTARGSDVNIVAHKRIVQISYPVPVPPCNPWRGAPLPATCPYKNCPLAIPHFSAGGLDFLFEDFEKAFLRYLGTGTHSGANQTAVPGYGTQVNTNLSTDPVLIKYVDKSAELEIKYFRLSHTRSLKESYRFNVWQAQTFPGPVPPSSADTNDGFVNALGFKEPDAAANFFALPPVGLDSVTSYVTQPYEHVASVITEANKSEISGIDASKVWKCSWDTISLAQVPSFLLISAPKLSSTYTMQPMHQGGSGALQQKAKTFNAQGNQSNNLSIKRLRIVVNATSGAIDHSGDDTGFIDQERLYRLTQENCNSAYFKEGGFRAWRDYGCAVLLSSAQFAPGLQVCDGISYPVSIRIEAEFVNKAVNICSLDTGAAHNGSSTQKLALGAPSLQLSRDYIRAQGQVTALFTKVVLSTTETSATTNAMNFPLDTAERLMSAAGAMR